VKLSLFSRDIFLFQAANLVYAIWLAMAVPADVDFPWRELLIIEALCWVSTAPFYTQSADIARLPLSDLTSIARLAVITKIAIATIVGAVWVVIRAPHFEVILVGAVSFAGPAILPQWRLFSHGFGLFTAIQVSLRLVFILAYSAIHGELHLLLFLFALPNIVPHAVLATASTYLQRGNTLSPAFKIIALNGVCYAFRYAHVAALSGTVLATSEAKWLGLIALLDRTLRPLLASMTPHLIKNASLFRPSLLFFSARASLFVGACVAFVGMFDSQSILLFYVTLLLLEIAGTAYFIGTRNFRRLKLTSLGIIAFAGALASLLLIRPLSTGVAVSVFLAVAGQVLYMQSETWATKCSDR
jgi:hypothetical protein